MIILDNGHKVLAEFINGEYDVDGTRMGGGTVVAFDREGYGGVTFYVTWVVYPSRDNHEIWWAETGHYGLTWDDAIADAIDRFNKWGFNKKKENYDVA